MNKALKIAIFSALIIYGLGITFLYYSNEKYEQEVAFYDVNKNGIIDNDEVNQNSKAIVDKGSKRKTTQQGAVILIPFSLFLGGITFAVMFLLGKIKTINDNEIIKSKSKRV
ncbi:hypothetical protein ACFFU1_05720 [Algibacter miyuki]|uniref:EF-hand domain-containing protein n=1 Tax=Algibacter miyuki TaxID=1306933 RepID=A0ABV5GXV8_9FLAO|nr:hypothetical protein [Algibacter miyuki]MDN3665914.1 hypothetical protein [Algibacter miyuki]